MIASIVPAWRDMPYALRGKCCTIYSCFGDVAQLIRALRWQRRGPGFESPYLHQTEASTSVELFYSMDGFFSLDDGFRIF